MANTGRKEIAIIGADSTHVTAFTELINQANSFFSYKVTGVYIDRRSSLSLSKKRIEPILEKLQSLDLEVYEGVQPVKTYDAYMILTMDADLHWRTLDVIKHENAPVFIDKPLVYRLEDLDKFSILSQKSYPFFSSSALAFSPFIKRLSSRVDEKTQKIIVEGPLYLEKEIPYFHWYGIHLLTMVQGIGQGLLKLTSLDKKGQVWIIKGLVNQIPFEIKGYLKDMHEFKARVINDTSTHFDSINYDAKPLYSYLLEEIMIFFEKKKSPIDFSLTKNIHEVLDQMNQMI